MLPQVYMDQVMNSDIEQGIGIEQREVQDSCVKQVEEQDAGVKQVQEQA